MKRSSLGEKVLSVMDDAGQGRARCRKAREGFASPLSLLLLLKIRIRIKIRIKEERLFFYHSISSSGSPRLLVAFSSGAGSRIPHLMSDKSRVVLGKLHCCTLSCWVELLPVAPLCRVIVCPETSRLDTPPVSSSHGWGKLGEVEKVLEELEKTRLAAAEVNDEGED